MTRLNTVWIIDDDPIFTYGLKKMISLTNFCRNVLCFDNGEKALINLRSVAHSMESLPDVILLDLNMPIVDGWQFLDAFTELELPRNIRIYIASSSIDIVDHTKAKQYKGISDFLVKPLKKSDLHAILVDHSSSTDLGERPSL